MQETLMHSTIHSVRNADTPGVRRSCDISKLAARCNINVMWFEPGYTVPWCRHKAQSDEFFVAAGSMVVGLCAGSDDSPVWQTLTADMRGTLSIPAGLWHCFRTSREEGCVLVYVISPGYDTACPDCEWAANSEIALPAMPV
jgi:dTDP-4-dehydrorhamnose 3,5-epimerase-like enzyme